MNSEKPIDRKALVQRHNPEYRSWDSRSPLSVGNGDFAFTADFTGLQTCSFDSPGSIPRCTMSQRGFHSYPGVSLDNSLLKLREYPSGEGTVGYMTDSTGQEKLFEDLRINPHRFHLGKVGLFFADLPDERENSSGFSAEKLLQDHVSRNVQKLDLWTGMLDSQFDFDGSSVSVSTVCHPDLSLISVRIESSLIEKGIIGLDLRFPYGSHEIGGADWTKSGAHRSDLSSSGPGRYKIRRVMDQSLYSAELQFFGREKGEVLSPEPHHWKFTGGGGVLEFSILFSFDKDQSGNIPGFVETAKVAGRFWEDYWNDGAAISFEGSQDPLAQELERRVILSLYLLGIQSLGSLPPAETGLTCNSWYGKFHLEMHPWHALFGLLWNRSSSVEKSLHWYKEILQSAEQRAADQGYDGARWPKMTDPSGRDSPSPIGCLLCWQQPHLILFAELIYRQNPSEKMLGTYADLIFKTADFMADYALWEETNHRYVLSSPLIPAQENHSPEDTLNPLFELEYWRWGLKTAVEWKRRLQEPVPPLWEKVLKGLSPCPEDPLDRERYASHENCSDSYGVFGTDHPSMLLAFGFLPPQTADPLKMSRSLDEVLKSWNMETLWGWDFPSMAMTLARLGRPREAVEVLLMDSPKNTYLQNGHNRQEGHPALPLYLPGNGALLLAVAMMAAGWEGSEGENPGFPDDRSWKVRWENLARYI